MAPVQSFCTGMLRINSARGPGFAERYTLMTGDLNVARNQIRMIANYRSRILAYGYRIVMANASVFPSTRRTRFAYNYLATGIKLTTDATSFLLDGLQNNASASMEWEFFTANGRHVTRGFRAIRDAWAADEQLLHGTKVVDPLVVTNPAPPTVPAAGTLTAPAIPTGSSTYTQAIDAFIRVVGNFTCLADPRGQAAGDYELRPFVAVYSKGIGSRDTGAGYSARRARRKVKV